MRTYRFELLDRYGQEAGNAVVKAEDLQDALKILEINVLEKDHGFDGKSNLGIYRVDALDTNTLEFMELRPLKDSKEKD